MAKREKNPCGKTRKVDNPYEVWKNKNAGWEWRVLKKYQSPSNEAKNPYARWHCAVKSPFTHGSWDFGDVYVTEIIGNADKVTDPEEGWFNSVS